MKDAKQIIGHNKDLGGLIFGKARKAPKMVEVDVSYDEKCENALFKAGMMALKYDKEAVIAYVIRKALEEKLKCKK
jgi:hypothetical protein